MIVNINCSIKRYAISNHDVSSAIQQAKADGYNGDEYEVEYGEGKKH